MPVSSICSRFIRSEKGTYSIIFALSLIPLVGIAGLAVDYGRALLLRSELQYAVDAALLAAARKPLISESALEDYALTYIKANSRFDSDSVELDLSRTPTGVQMSARFVAETYLMPVLGFDGVEISAASEVMVGTGDIEVALVLDVTGSMCANGIGPCTSSQKLDGLKSAAQQLIDTVISGDQSQRKTRVSLVPFSTRIRVGADGSGAQRMLQMTNLDPMWSGWYVNCTDSSGSGGSEGNGNWVCNATQTAVAVDWKIMPCVTDRFHNDGWSYVASDSAPSVGNWLNAHGGDRRPQSWDSTEAQPVEDDGTTPAKAVDFWNYSPDGYCSDVAEANEFLPLTNDKGLLSDRLANLEAYGSTSGALGTAFGWYTLSPHWSGIFAGDSAPDGYDKLVPDPLTGMPRLKKAAVIMTDGVYNTYRGWKDADQQQVSDYATDVCDGMKAAGIEIYTVGFALDQLPAGERAIAEATLQDCSTDTSHYYGADTVAELTQAFQAIGSKLSALRVAR